LSAGVFNLVVLVCLEDDD